ncbi:MAG: Ig-like domain-containing protein [Bacilli bacterium]
MKIVKTLGLIFFITFLVGCFSPSEEPHDDELVIEPQINTVVIEINPKTVDLLQGMTFQLFPVLLNTTSNLPIGYTSSDSEVAIISSEGLIEAKAKGQCFIEIFLIEKPEIKTTIDITIQEKETPIFPLALSGPDSISVGETLSLIGSDLNNPDGIVFWESSNPTILFVDGEGKITGINPGIVKITISSYYTDDYLEKEITVNPVIPTNLEILTPDSLIYAPNTEKKVEAKVLPINAKQEVIWSTNDEEIASINQFGLVSFHKSGEIIIEAQVKDYPIYAYLSLKVEIPPLSVFDILHVNNPLVKNDVMYWAYSDPIQNDICDVYGSVSRYLFTNLSIDNTSYWLSSSAANFDSRTFEQPEYIVIHDTWNPVGAGAGNAAIVTSLSNTKTCWHFTVGNDGIFQSLSEYQYGKHAGDGGRDFALIDTGIKANNNQPVLEISDDGYWVINDEKSNLLVPLLLDKIATVNNLTDSGILIEENELGNYVIGTTYYNDTYNVIANTGGNARGIGIETAMNFGSDLYFTWQQAAKLTADLMYRHHLDINRVRQHNFFSGKDCPRTMRKAALWNEFLSLVEAEYLAVSNLKGYTINFISHNPEFVNEVGRIIKLPNENTKVSYTVQIFNETGLVAEKTYYSIISAK